jgi:hypothetical protein
VTVPHQNGYAACNDISGSEIQLAIPAEISQRDAERLYAGGILHLGSENSIPVAQQHRNCILPVIRHGEIHVAAAVKSPAAVPNGAQPTV